MIVLGTADVIAALTKLAADQQEPIKQMAVADEQHLPYDQAQSLKDESALNKLQELIRIIGDIAIQTTTQTATRWTVIHCLTWLSQH